METIANPVDFLIDFLEKSDVSLGTDQVTYLLAKEGWGPSDISATLNDSRLYSHYRKEGDLWGASSSLKIDLHELRQIIKEELQQVTTTTGIGGTHTNRAKEGLQ